LRITGTTESVALGIAGGGVSDVTLVDVTVSGNQSLGAVAGIEVGALALLTMTRCTVADNTNLGDPDQGSDGAGIVLGDETVVAMTDCLITRNRVVLGSGAGIVNEGLLRLTDTDVTDNEAGDRGGGIFNGSLGNLSITGTSDVTGNTANGGPGSGGGIYNEGLLLFDGGDLSPNTPDDCVNAGSGVGCP
jgi:hypothetical protein